MRLLLLAEIRQPQTRGVHHPGALLTFVDEHHRRGVRTLGLRAERRVGTGHGMRLPVPGNAYAVMASAIASATRTARSLSRDSKRQGRAGALAWRRTAARTSALAESSRRDHGDIRQRRAIAIAQIQACAGRDRYDCFRSRAGWGCAAALPRTQPSCRGRADGCIARMMRKPNRARSTSDASLLLL